jgi:hypothetical protein
MAKAVRQKRCMVKACSPLAGTSPAPSSPLVSAPAEAALVALTANPLSVTARSARCKLPARPGDVGNSRTAHSAALGVKAPRQQRRGRAERRHTACKCMSARACRALRSSSRRAGGAVPGTAAPLTRSAEPGGPALCAALGCGSLAVPPTGPAQGSAPRTAPLATHSALAGPG